MFDRILVGVDGSPHSTHVLAVAQDLALKTRSKVLIAHIQDVSLPLTLTASTGPAGTSVPSGDHDVAAADELVQGAARTFRAAGVDARGEVATGSGATARELLNLADSFKADTIVVGHHGSAMAQMLLGSVAYWIVHQASCPVLIVH